MAQTLAEVIGLGNRAHPSGGAHSSNPRKANILARKTPAPTPPSTLTVADIPQEEARILSQVTAQLAEIDELVAEGHDEVNIGGSTG